MTTLENINSELADNIFNMTGFDYDIKEVENEDGTVNITFDSTRDADKFKSLM